jgi:multidrug efflux pump subunit AcrA (membrane-fusion protein)
MNIVKLIKRPKLSLTLLAIIILSSGIAFFSIKEATHTHKVKKQNFEAFLSCKGEIQAEKSLLINFPDILGDASLNIYELQIKDLVLEGTIVKKGDYVALLDQGRIKQLMQANAERLRSITAEYTDAKIDSAVNLKSARDEIEQLVMDLKYNQIDVEQAVYESPAYQRKTQIAYDRTARLLEAKKRNYLMLQKHLGIRCSRDEQMYNDLATRDKKYQQALEATTIKAPADGMIIYARRWGRYKTKIGDAVSPSNPVIATLPDLNILISETYMEEIYISKIKTGDSVRVYIDALKNKEIPGIISNIANIGQDMSGFDAKVFKLNVRLNGDLSKLRPSMTTNNEVIIKKVEKALVIPLNYLFSENGKEFVYLKEQGKITRRSVKTGEKNDKEVIIISGLKENDRISAEPPKV